ILTVSDHASAGIIERFQVRRERVRVVLEAPDPIFRRLPSPRDVSEVLPRLPLPRGCRFLLYVGGLSPHKNLPLLIDAYRSVIAEPEFAELRLLLVGDYAGDVFYSAYPELRSLVARYGLEGRVLFTGYVPDDVLVHLYNRAELVVLPSLEEGFGLPAIEAAACGKPVVASEVSPIGDLLGPAATTFPPRDGTALTQALETLLRDPDKRRAMGAEAARRAAGYTWERAAAQVHALFHEAHAA
ncbi:MAG: glycosyltransferase, partial [bacterium]